MITTTGTTGVQQLCWHANRLDRRAGHQGIEFRLADDATLAAWKLFFAAWSATSADVLRTTFGEDRGTVVAYVHDKPAESVIDMGRFDTEHEARDQIWEIISNEFSELNSLPILKSFVARVNGSEHMAVVVSEHIVHDGVMIGVAAAGIAATRKQGELPAEFAKAATYQGDYLAAEQQLLRSAEATLRMRFWERQIGDVAPLNTGGSGIRAAQPEGVPGLLREVSIPDTPFWSQNTAFDQLAAGIAILARPWIVQEDIILNMPWSRRPSNPQFGLTAGNMIDYLPIRVRVDPALCFDELVTQIAESRKQARRNYLPFAHIVREFGLSLSADSIPFLQVMVNAMPAVAAPVLLQSQEDLMVLADGVLARPLPRFIGRALERQDISILVARYPGVLRWQFGARKDVLTDDQRADWDDRLGSIIKHAVSDPTAKIAYILDHV